MPVLTPSRLLYCLLALAGAAPCVTQAGQTNFQPTDWFSIQTGTDPQISPDGKRIAYVRVHPDIVKDEYQHVVWVMDADGRNASPLTEAKEGAAEPRWSPDGTRLAFIANRDGAPHIVIHWLSNGVETLIGGFASQPFNMEWSPDGKLLAFAQLEPAAPRQIGTPLTPPPGAAWKPQPVVIDRGQYRADGMGYLPPGHVHFYVMPAQGGAIRRLTADDSGELPPIGRFFDWSPDSRGLVAALVHHSELEILHGRMFDSGLYWIPVDGTGVVKLIDRDGPEASPSVSPDGRYVAYVGHDDTNRSYTIAQLYILDRKTGESRAITPALDRDVAYPRWAANGKGIYAYFADHGVNRLALFDLNGGYKVITENIGSPMTAYTGEPSYSLARDNTIAMQWVTQTSTGDIAVVRADGRPPQRVTDYNDALFKDRTLGSIEEINYRSAYGNLPIQGWIIRPPGFDPTRRYPLILEIHGGPDACYGPRFDPEKQLMAAAGYMVLYVNPRGSTGYGGDFGNLLQDDFPGHELEDLLSGVDAAVASGHVDPEHLYVTGGSGGGTLTAWLISHTPRFRAAAVLYPVIDFQSEALTSDILPLVFHGFFHGTPWSQPQIYREHSLLSHVDQVHTPTLVMTGESDYRTPISESEQYFAALRYQGVESVFVREPMESHGLRVFPSHAAAKIPMITGWFDEHR